ncbi:hypothetical protein DSM21852_01470 [Methylocystis bryophila]|nr:hypothetical protein DSM21852_01470 [Methylocystis bryophila]
MLNGMLIEDGVTDSCARPDGGRRYDAREKFERDSQRRCCSKISRDKHMVRAVIGER